MQRFRPNLNSKSEYETGNPNEMFIFRNLEREKKKKLRDKLMESLQLPESMYLSKFHGEIAKSISDTMRY